MSLRAVTLALLGLTLGSAPAARAQGGAGQNPHGALPESLDCSACHGSGSWRPLKSPLPFDHGKVSGFTLTGGHAAVACERCHLDLKFDAPRVTLADCAHCHVDVHQGRIAGECSRCHNAAGFHEVPAVALHSQAGFPLSGSHLQAPCESCHRNDRGGAFAPVPRDCIACHQADYAAATTPDHAAAGFPTDCQQCHAPLTWTGGVAFDHATAAHGYTLVGAHALLRCANCHVPPGLSLRFTPAGQNDCLACHQSDYQRAHGPEGFPTTCTDCHSQNSWSGADFDHSQYFPLSGAHRVSCATCHTTPGNFVSFTCTTCHTQPQTDERHREVQGYQYDSAACYQCHRSGRGESG